MFNDLNQCSFTGRLGKAPEIRTFNNGGKVCSFSLAVSESWKPKDGGERRESTEWVNVQVFGDGLVSLCERFLKKGSKALVRGKLKTRKYQTQSGEDRYSTEVVLQGFDAFIQCLDGKSGHARGDDGLSHQNSDGFEGAGSGAAGNDWVEELEDEIPFLTADFRYERKRRQVL